MAKVAFAAIEIVGCDPEMVKRASKSNKLFVFPFSLSAKPKEEWEDVFEHIWDSSRKKSSARKTRASVRKGEILIQCALSDIKLAFGEVKQCVIEANSRYVEEMEEKAKKSAKKKQKEEAEKLSMLSAVREALDGIDLSSAPVEGATAKPKKPKKGPTPAEE